MIGPRLGAAGRWPIALAACVALACAESLRLGKDANWDLQNYHFYNAYALLNRRLWLDVAPAMMQTFHNPLADLPFYGMVQAGMAPITIILVMALPAGIGAYFLLRLLGTLFPEGVRYRGWWIGCAFAIGITGSAGRGVIGSTMNEWLCTALVMAALVLLASAIARGFVQPWRLGLAGALCGAAMGLKLTYGTFALAIGVATLASATWRVTLRRAAWLALGGIAGFAATYGWWGAILQRELANPFFPYFNGFFASPWWETASPHDTRYGPHNLWEAITYPFRFAFNGRIADDTNFRDPRIAVVLLLGVAWLAAGRRRAPLETSTGTREAWRFILVFAATGYVTWLAAFGIYRYLIPVELVSGALIVQCLNSLAHSDEIRRRVAVGAAVLLFAATMKPHWGRIPPGDSYFGITAPAVAANAVIVLEPQQPLAHVIPFFAPEARFVSPASNLLQPSQANGLARRTSELLVRHPGPIYALDRDGASDVDALLAYYRLRRDMVSCKVFDSPVFRGTLRLCRVSRGTT